MPLQRTNWSKSASQAAKHMRVLFQRKGDGSTRQEYARVRVIVLHHPQSSVADDCGIHVAVFCQIAADCERFGCQKECCEVRCKNTEGPVPDGKDGRSEARGMLGVIESTPLLPRQDRDLLRGSDYCLLFVRSVLASSSSMW